MNHQEHSEKSILGFWLYLMTDLLTFAVLFAAYAVLHGNTAGGPGAKELFDLKFVLIETILLLTSSFTVGLAMLALHEEKKNSVIFWLGVTFLLGAAFLGMEIYEFNKLVGEGFGPQRSAFLSSFFTLVGTHGLHIASGLLWMAVGIYMVMKKGLSPFINSKITRLSLFWHFLDIVWIFIFTIVYLYGHL